jgi:hypothetical protein
LQASTGYLIVIVSQELSASQPYFFPDIWGFLALAAVSTIH